MVIMMVYWWFINDQLLVIEVTVWLYDTALLVLHFKSSLGCKHWVGTDLWTNAKVTASENQTWSQQLPSSKST